MNLTLALLTLMTVIWVTEAASSLSQVLPIEAQCSSAGGICVQKGTCPEMNRVPGVTCAQKNDCCFGLPNTITKCKSRGGECQSKEKCGAQPTDPSGKCPSKNEVCCIQWNFEGIDATTTIP